MNPIEPSVALNAIKGADNDEMLGIQFGRPHPAGGARPARVYLCQTFFVNVEPAGVVAYVMEAGGMLEAWEIPESREANADIIERLSTKAAECAPEYEDLSSSEDQETIFFAGNEEMASKINNKMDIPDAVDVKINEGEPEYIPEPTS